MPFRVQIRGYVGKGIMGFPGIIRNVVSSGDGFVIFDSALLDQLLVRSCPSLSLSAESYKLMEPCDIEYVYLQCQSRKD